MVNLRTLHRSFGYALEGIGFALKFNQNLRIAFAGALAVIIASLYFKVNPFEMGILGVMILLVICAEMINTSIEEMTNLITNEHRKEAKIAKDVSAGMVVITLAGSIIVGLLIFVPYILRMLNIA
jgi:diacylglycerol kinase (ATP)